LGLLGLNYPDFTVPVSEIAEVPFDSKLQTPLQKFQSALDVAGVADEIRKTILDYFSHDSDACA
jgi:hypothetical protein